jgi:hypothetical protein
MYTLLMNTWNTLLGSYQQWLYTNTLAAVKCQIQQVEIATPPVAVSVDATCVGNDILVDCLTFKAALEQPEIGSTGSNIPMDCNYNDDKEHVWMRGGCMDCDDKGDESDEHNANPTPSQ